jgi:hypothetical protein
MGGFLSAIFGGANPTLGKDMNQFGAMAGNQNQTGTGDVNSASQYFQNILSGNPTQIAQTLAPETAAVQGQTQQAKNQAAQFGTRSGGTGSTVAGLDANGRSQLIQLIGQLQGGAASGAASLGTSQEGLASQNTGQQAQLSQEQLANFMNSILGKSISSGIGEFTGAGLDSATRAIF